MSGHHEAPRVQTPRLDPARFRWRTVRYNPHQNTRERLRRLKQIATRRLQGACVTPAAATVARFMHVLLSVWDAESACYAYWQEAAADAHAEHAAARESLYHAVHDLARFLDTGDPESATSSASVSAAADRLGGDQLVA